MKKFTFMVMVAATMLFAVTPLFAEGVTLGIKGGLNIANVTGGDKEVDTSSKMGLVAGGFLCYNINEIFALQPEFLFSMKGWKVTVEGVEGTAKLNYIEIPLLLKVNLPTEGKIDPSLYAGPGFGILLSARASDGEEEDNKDRTASLDIGVIAGAGLAYQMESGALSFEARYEVGLTSLAKDKDSGPDMLNSVISIMVGYGFAF